jgi:hypothetical protein
VVHAAQKGADEAGTTMMVVEVSGDATLGQVVTAIEKATTPHASKVKPSVAAATLFKLKLTATRAQVEDALRKAGLLED